MKRIGLHVLQMHVISLSSSIITGLCRKHYINTFLVILLINLRYGGYALLQLNMTMECVIEESTRDMTCVVR